MPDSLPVDSEAVWPAQSGVYNGQSMWPVTPGSHNLRWPVPVSPKDIPVKIKQMNFNILFHLETLKPHLKENLEDCDVLDITHITELFLV